MAASSTSFRKGNKPTENWYKAMAAKRGTKRPPFSAEWRANMSRTRIGRPSRMKGRHFSEQARAGIAAAQNKRLLGKRGPQTPRWISDRTKLRASRTHMYDTNYKIWMREVKTRDGWKCRIMDATCNGRLEAHHILPWSKFPELRYQVNNGITLCHHHHPRTRTRTAEMELSPYFQSLVTDAQ